MQRRIFMNDDSYKISIEVTPNYIEEQSKPEQGHYVFSYTVTIINDGSQPARLLTRHWVITSPETWRRLSVHQRNHDENPKWLYDGQLPDDCR